MALKHKINKAAYDKLSDEIKGEYIAGEGENEFVLDVTGLPTAEDVEPIKRALENVRNEVKTLKKEKGDLQTKLDGMPDIDALNATHAATTKKLTDFTTETLVNSEAMKIASGISTAPELMADAIVKRLSVDLTGDKPKTVILGLDGKPNPAATFDTLSQEFVADKKFATIIKVSNARGGGAPLVPTKPNGGSAPVDGDKAPDVLKLSTTAFAERIAARKAAAAEGAGA